MTDKTNWLLHDHRKYEAALAECELAAGAGAWKEAVQLFNDFVEALKLHMRMEDEVLYPFYVEEMGDPDDAILDLTDEHDTLVRLLRDLVYIIKTKNYDHFEESLAPLQKAMVEHNAHEEAVFKHMKNDSLLTHRDEILDRLHAMQDNQDQRSWDFLHRE